MNKTRYPNKDIEDAVIVVKKVIPTDTSDNFLQRAVDRLEESRSNSKVELFRYIMEELLSFKKTPSL